MFFCCLFELLPSTMGRVNPAHWLSFPANQAALTLIASNRRGPMQAKNGASFT